MTLKKRLKIKQLGLQDIIQSFKLTILRFNKIIMRNQRNPQIKQRRKQRNSKRIGDFPRSLARNEEGVYEYILLMVKGDFEVQASTADCIFSHLKNVLNNQNNTNALKYASRFITTIILVGNIHLYERFITYLLPVFRAKIIQQSKVTLKPVWPVEQFCKQILFIMAMWLPFDFYDESLPSAFANTVKQLGIKCDQFRFMNVDKIIISYRIVKSLGLQEFDEPCVCHDCKNRKSGKLITPDNHTQNTNKQMRERLYILNLKSNLKDNLFQTGFSIQFEQEISQMENMIQNKLKSYYTRQVPQESIIFYRLRQKMEILEDDINIVKSKYTEKKSTATQNDNQQQNISISKNMFETPRKRTSIQDPSISSNTHLSSKKYISPNTDLKMAKSLPNFELLALQQQFNYQGYMFFQNIVRLESKQLQKFKHSLLCFDQKMYLKQQVNGSIYCIALARKNKIKIRVNSQGKQNILENYSVGIANNELNYDFNEQKYQYTIKISNHFEPIRLSVYSQNREDKLVLPIGFIKLLEPLPDSAVQAQKLTFKMSKTVKLQNKFIISYEYFVSRLVFLERLVDKARTNNIPRLFQSHKLKKKLQRRYRLFETEILLTLRNNNTQYIDIEVRCLDQNIHRRNACQVLKEFIYICVN